MKTARFLFTMVGFGALTLGVGFAAEPSSPPSERVPRENHASSVRSVGPGHGSRDHMERNSARSSQPGPLHTQTKRALGNGLHQPGLKRAATAANGGWMMNKIEHHHEQPAKLPGGSGTTAPWPGVTRSRSAAAAVIGGLTASSAKNSAAALDGTAIRRKP
jgi:hypothetical protein